jgi:hypothetical protein
MQVTRKTAWTWVEGHRFPEHHLEQICALLQVTPETLLYPPPPDNLIEQLDAVLAARPVTLEVPGDVSLSTGYPEVDAVVAYIRGELTQIWESSSEEDRTAFLAHYARQVYVYRTKGQRRAPAE